MKLITANSVRCKSVKSQQCHNSVISRRVNCFIDHIFQCTACFTLDSEAQWWWQGLTGSTWSKQWDSSCFKKQRLNKQYVNTMKTSKYKVTFSAARLYSSNCGSLCLKSQCRTFHFVENTQAFVHEGCFKKWKISQKQHIFTTNGSPLHITHNFAAKLNIKWLKLSWNEYICPWFCFFFHLN